jgi:prepilin-type N-terminal cleavage/methylation domain-containing protein
MRQKMKMMMERKGQAGFSMIELMIAMVVTLIVTGAVFGLLTEGQSSFKLQPERTDRQQNIRSAMDLIMRDISSAGDGMPPFIQTFTPGLEAVGPVGPDSVNTDELEILANTGAFKNELVCNAPGKSNSSQITLLRPTSALSPNTVVMIFMADGTWTIRNVLNTTNPSGAADGCDATPHVQLNIKSGGDPTGMNQPAGSCQPSKLGVGNAGVSGAGNPLSGCTDDPCAEDPLGLGVPCCCRVTEIGMGQLLRYRIRNGADAVPNLERSENSGPFQVVARGIENLQVQYVQANTACTPAAPCDGAPALVQNDYNTVITQARVTLSARSSYRGRLQGETTSLAGETSVRGSLVSTATPRAALFVLNQQTPTPIWK